MIGPTTDAFQPGFEETELWATKFCGQFFQQEHGEDFFFENAAGEEPVCDLQQKFQAVIFLEKFALEMSQLQMKEAPLDKEAASKIQ